MKTAMRRAAAAVATLLLTTAAAAAQQGRGIVTLAGGTTNYDLAGTGWAPAAALRVGLPLSPWLVVEPGLGWMRYETQGDDDTTLLFPEMQLQLELLRGVVRPYVGAGAGLARLSSGGRDETDLTLSAAAGVRARLTGTLGLVAEGRLRSVDPWAGTTADLTAGLTIAF